MRHGEIFRSDRLGLWGSGARNGRLHAPAHRLDEFPAGYSWAGCAPAEPASASPTGSYYEAKGRRWPAKTSERSTVSKLFVSPQGASPEGPFAGEASLMFVPCSLVTLAGPGGQECFQKGFHQFSPFEFSARSRRESNFPDGVCSRGSWLKIISASDAAFSARFTISGASSCVASTSQVTVASASLIPAHQSFPNPNDKRKIEARVDPPRQPIVRPSRRRVARHQSCSLRSCRARTAAVTISTATRPANGQATSARVHHSV